MLYNQQEVIDRLLLLDYQLGQTNFVNKIKFCIFGGTAFLFFTEHRVTSDVDIILLEEIHKDYIVLLDKFDINNSMQNIATIPDDYVKRMIQLEGFKNMEVYIAHPIDLIISKLLGRTDQRDVLDIVESGILGQVNLDQLRRVYNETLEYTTGPKIKYYNIEDIIDRYLNG